MRAKARASRRGSRSLRPRQGRQGLLFVRHHPVRGDGLLSVPGGLPDLNCGDHEFSTELCGARAEGIPQRGGGPRIRAERPYLRRLSALVGIIGAVLVALLIASCGTGAGPPPVPGPIGPPSGSSGPPLSWALPALEDPETIALGPGTTSTDLEAGKDYILTVPEPGRATRSSVAGATS